MQLPVMPPEVVSAAEVTTSTRNCANEEEIIYSKPIAQKSLM